MTAEAPPLADLGEMLSTARARAASTGRPVLASRTERIALRDPLDLYAAALARGDDCFYWEHRSEGVALAGAGCALELTARDGDEVRRLSRCWKDVVSSAVTVPDAAYPLAGPFLFGGLPFDPEARPTGLWRGFEGARFVLPERAVVRSGDGTWLTLNRVAWPEGHGDAGSEADAPQDGSAASSRPGDSSDWKCAVAEVVREIQRGTAEKVVLARAVSLTSPDGFDVVSALRDLRESYPGCFVFAVTRCGATFLGATPERLVALSGRRVLASCLAGTASRGRTEAEDAALADALLRSRKDAWEHEVVVRSLLEALDRCCERVEAPERPAILKLTNVQHLYTPLCALARPNQTALDLALELHPTPAVGGAPREEALRLIRRYERLDRGWYSGPVGWMGADGDGELAVAIRSALVRGREAALFAGCGIVAESDPDSEHEESRSKLRPMLEALRGRAG